MSWIDVETHLRFWGGSSGQPLAFNIVSISQYRPYGNAVGTFDSIDETNITEALEQLYFGSLTARTLLESAVLTGSGEIWFVNVTGQTGPSGALLGSYTQPFISRTVGVDLTQPTRLKWMGSNGRFQNENLAGNIIHELIHAVTGEPDTVQPPAYNQAGYDFLGPTVSA